MRLPEVQRTTLGNGLTVLVAQKRALPLLAMRLLVWAGSAIDPRGKHGLADFTARLLRRGTAKLSADQIDEAVELCGGSLAAGGHQDYLSLGVSAPSEHLGKMLEVVGQLLTEPVFPLAEVESQQKRVLAEIASELDDPASLAERAATQTFYGEHPYGHEVNGKAADVRTFSREDVARFHVEAIGPLVSTLVLVGDVEPRGVVAMAERALGAWSGGPKAPPSIPRAAVGKMGRVIVVDKPEQTQTQVRIGAEGIPRAHHDYFRFAASNAVLGVGFTSRLMTEIRVKRGLSYGAHSQLEALAAGGTFEISTFTRTETTRQILDVAFGEVARMRQKGIRRAELSATQRYVTGLFPARLETNEALAGALAEIEAYGLPADWLTNFRERFAAVTPEDATEAARRYLFEGTPTVVLVGNAEAIQPQVKDLGEVIVRELSDLE